MSEGLEYEGRRSKQSVSILFTVFASVLLEYFALTSFLFIFPLLAFAAVSQKKECWKVFLPTFLIVLFKSLYQSWGVEHACFWIFYDLYVPVSLLAAGAIWVYSKPRKLEVRLLLCLLPCFLMTLSFGVIFYLDGALFNEVWTSLRDAFVVLMEGAFSSINIGIDLEFLFLVSVVSVAVFAFPSVMAAVCASVFYYENKRHSREGGFDEKVAEIELSQNTIWLLIAFLFLFLVGRLVSMPMAFSILLMSLLIAMLILYAIQGFSVIVARMRNKGLGMKSSQLFIMLVLFSLIVPGLNLIVFLGLPLLGILENFFSLKIRRKK